MSIAVPVLFGAQANGPVTHEKVLDQALNVVQRASQSSAAAAINKLALRLASGTDRLFVGTWGYVLGLESMRVEATARGLVAV